MGSVSVRLRAPPLKADTDGLGQMAAGGRLAAAPQSDIIRQFSLCSFSLSPHILTLLDHFVIEAQEETSSSV